MVRSNQIKDLILIELDPIRSIWRTSRHRLKCETKRNVIKEQNNTWHLFHQIQNHVYYHYSLLTF